MAPYTVEVRLEMTNEEAVERLLESLDLVESLQEDLPWKDELQELSDNLQYICDNVEFRMQ